MSKGQTLLGILLFALATAILYVWGLHKSMGQSADLTRILLNRCGNKVVEFLKKHDTVTEAEIAQLISGVTAGEFWSRKHLVVQEPKQFSVGPAVYRARWQQKFPVEKVNERIPVAILENLEP